MAFDFLRANFEAIKRALLLTWILVCEACQHVAEHGVNENVFDQLLNLSLSLSPSFSGLLVSPSISTTFQLSLDQQCPFHPINAG